VNDLVLMYDSKFDKFPWKLGMHWMGLLNKKYCELMLDTCRQHHISINLRKCIFCVPCGILLGHIV